MKNMERWWKDTDRGNQSTERRNHLRLTLPTINLTWTDEGSNPSLHGGGPATNHVTAAALVSRDSCGAQDRDKTNALLLSFVALLFGLQTGTATMCLLHTNQRSTETSVDRESGWLRAGRSGNRIPVGSEILRTCPDQPWGPPSLLYKR
jgi:hypothetical protein